MINNTHFGCCFFVLLVVGVGGGAVAVEVRVESFFSVRMPFWRELSLFI